MDYKTYEKICPYCKRKFYFGESDVTEVRDVALNHSNYFYQVTCMHCGNNILLEKNFKGKNFLTNPNQTNTFALIGFILSLVGVSLLGLIFSILGLTQIKETNENGSGLAIAGIIISIAQFVFIIIFVIIYLAVLFSIVSKY